MTCFEIFRKSQKKEKWKRSARSMTFSNYFVLSSDKGFMYFSHDTVAASELARLHIKLPLEPQLVKKRKTESTRFSVFDFSKVISSSCSSERKFHSQF
jgi:hypothetical protein